MQIGGTACTSIWADYYVCTGIIGSSPVPTSTRPASTASPALNPTPQPIQDGMVSNCNRWYRVKAGDTCATVASQVGVTVAQLTTWNKGIGGTACTGMWAEYYLCTGISAGSSTPPVSTDSRCGATSSNRATYAGSAFGNCCSVKGNCGTSDAFYTTSNLCQPLFGTCNPTRTDGKCGAASSTRASCSGSKFGNCCSVKGNCGSSAAFCAVANLCQPVFGTCNPTSTDGKCGSASSATASCNGSKFGDCCSVKGNCGSSAAFCAVSNLCQPIFGTCT